MTDSVLSEKTSATEHQQTPTIERDLEVNSKFWLKKRLADTIDIERKFLRNTYVPFDLLPRHVQQFRSIYVGQRPNHHWATIGVVDRSIQRKTFGVCRLTDMRGLRAHLFVMGKAYTAYEKQLEAGAVLGVFEPTIVWSSDQDADVGLLVTSPDHILLIGTSYDMVRCQQMIRQDKQCDAMVDGRSGSFCDRHLARLCSKSKNTRMELASGDSAIEVRWARLTHTDRGDKYLAASNSSSSSSSSSSSKSRNGNQTIAKMEFTYTIKGRGAITSEGIELHAKKQANTKIDKKALAEALRGRTDPGSAMIRKVHGIKDDRSNLPAVSREAMLKMGMSTRQVLSKEEEAAKKRSIDQLLKTTANQNGGGGGDDPQKKPRYIYL
ncbi:hypothetical protein BX666DRAFT_1998878 [Dichotomocladium elegans]|nr:hypothetical protein BX666DRAFT_1998878 [Dichotomocladium elegans]